MEPVIKWLYAINRVHSDSQHFRSSKRERVILTCYWVKAPAGRVMRLCREHHGTGLTKEKWLSHRIFVGNRGTQKEKRTSMVQKVFCALQGQTAPCSPLHIGSSQSCWKGLNSSSISSIKTPMTDRLLLYCITTTLYLLAAVRNMSKNGQSWEGKTGFQFTRSSILSSYLEQVSKLQNN